MKPRERVIAALSHQEVDRIPVDFCGLKDAVIHRKAYEELRAYLGLQLDKPDVARLTQGVVYAAEELLLRYGADCRSVHLPESEQEGELQADGTRLLVGRNGSVLRKPAGGLYYDVVTPALTGELTSEAIAAVARRLIDTATDEDQLGVLRRTAKRLHEETDYAVVMDGFLIQPATGTAFGWRGFEQWCIDALTDTVRWQEMIEAFMQQRLDEAERILQAVGPFIDVAYMIGDDVANQRGPWISPSFYRQYIKPWHQLTMDFIRARTNAKIVFHLCGAAREFIPDLIDIGADAVNPVQTAARGMDPEALKRDFGDHIAFWGGVDTQHVLPFGTPAEVRQEVRRCINTLGPSGYVLASCHNIQAGVPPENIEAMFAAAAELGG